jgi:hypothetical protein
MEVALGRRANAPQITKTTIAPATAPMSPAPVSSVQTHHLSEVGRDKRTSDTEESGYDKTAGFVVSRVQKFGDDPGNEADDNCPMSSLSRYMRTAEQG